MYSMRKHTRNHYDIAWKGVHPHSSCSPNVVQNFINVTTYYSACMIKCSYARSGVHKDINNAYKYRVVRV